MNLKEKFLEDEFDSELQKNLFYLGLCVVLISGMVAANNVMTSGESVEVGPTHIFYECHGIDVGICLGIETPDHETHDFDDFEEMPEEGTDEYYRRVEAELMLQAYRICEDQSLTGMDWLEDAEYDDRTGNEWYEMDEINLIGCEETFRFQVDD